VVSMIDLRDRELMHDAMMAGVRAPRSVHGSFWRRAIFCPPGWHLFFRKLRERVRQARIGAR
jgi:hypothetical protein